MSEQRASQACLACRQKKIKCVPVPSASDDDRCRRCTRLSLECAHPDKKERTQKSKLRGRVEQLENNYAQILSLLDSQSRPIVSEAAGINVSQTTTIGVPTPEYSVTTSDADNGVLSQAELQSAIETYHKMSAGNFPFVLLPHDCSASSLAIQRPMLSQAIGVVTSWTTPAAQSARQDHFLAVLGHKYFVKYERSLDLLQSLLVYFAWSHFYATPFARQAYRLASLAVNLALELGINERPSTTTQHQMIVQCPAMPQETSEALSGDMWSHDVRRAYVGAYTVSTFSSLLFRKPSPLTYTKYLHECAESLASDPQHQSDTMLVHRVQHLRIAEEVTRVFDHGSQEKLKEMDDSKIHVLLKALVRQLTDWQSSLPPSAIHDGKLNRSIMMCRAYLHEVGMYNLLQGQTPSIARIEIVVECFKAAKEYLTSVLEVRLSEMTEWTCLEWRTLNFAVMISSRAATILDSFCYNNDSVQRAGWIDHCFDSLSNRIRMLRSMMSSKQDHYFECVAAGWLNARLGYQQGVNQALAQASNAAPQAGVQIADPVFSADDMYNLSWNTFGFDSGFDSIEGF